MTEKTNTCSHENPDRILLIVVYFGSWPPWFSAYLYSCRFNPSIDWLFLTDCKPPDVTPHNVRFISTSRDKIQDLFSSTLKTEVSIPSNRKLCDLRPAYGFVFKDYIDGYDFWGFCDIDIIWGNIRKFYTRQLLSINDIISSRKHRLAGHFTLLRNCPSVNEAFRQHAEFKSIMACTSYCWFDEVGFSDLLESKSSNLGIRVLWDEYRVNFARAVDDLPSILSWSDKFFWQDGHLFSLSEGNKEIMYLHFMNWKNSLRFCDLKYSDKPNRFNINSKAITCDRCNPPLIYSIRAFVKTLLNPRYYILGWVRTIKRLKSPVP